MRFTEQVLSAPAVRYRMADSDPLPHPFFRTVREGAVPLIGPKELRELLEGPEPPLMLDVRSESERAWVHLPNDRHIPIHLLPRQTKQLPRNRPIVTYDHLGPGARRAAGLLRARGFDSAAALEGGIDEYARIVDPTLSRYREGAGERGLLLRQLPRPDTGCLAYFLADPVDRAAVLVDPGVETAPYLEALRTGDWHLAAIVETHTHADHLAGHSALHAATDAPIYLSRRSPAQYPHRTLADGEAIDFGSEELRVLETPGHTLDHLTLRVRDSAFVGDTLLIGSCGRTDLGDGSPELLWESLTDKLLRLPEEVEVFPAHFGPRHSLPARYVSTIGFERATNEALNQGSREAFVRYMTEGWPPKPSDFEEIVRANLEG